MFFLSLFHARVRVQGENIAWCCMVLLIFYIDMFEIERSCHALVEGIYMSFANAPTAEHCSANLCILLCEVLTGCDIIEVI
jgi:hypothetical protein